ncbi:hypothetical protein PVAND_016583 [Polypedilum vanderplanki]|uniref:Uncharacterized protein n=1 Tax=Polypedilum vanderplanki TaxID=319348 RepID=A0A9J6BFH8_POLVA|nr:hypothetical protein PVAND_016583 [Polypedilum vanderplanki]
METEIKQEDPLDYDFDSCQSYNPPISITYQQPEQATQSFPNSMPTKEEIENINDLTWFIIRSKYQRTCQLTSDNRSKLSRAIIKFIHMRHFEKFGTFDVRLTTQNFEYLTKIIIELFPTESAETYFIRSSKGKNASGKLYNSFINTRQEVTESGLVMTKRKSKENKFENYEEFDEEIEDNLATSTALTLCQKNDFNDLQEMTKAWNECLDERCKLLSRIGAHEYFGMFPYLNEDLGYKWLINDAHQKYQNFPSIDDLNLITSNIFDRLSRVKTHLSRTFIQDHINNADNVILALILLPYLFQQQQGKRSANGTPKVTKFDSYHRFLPHFVSITELEAFEDTQNFIEKPIQVSVIGSLERPYAILRVFNTKYNFNSPRCAVDAAFKSFIALNIGFPHEAAQPWEFLRKFIYKIDDLGKKNEKVYPQVETMINEINASMKIRYD